MIKLRKAKLLSIIDHCIKTVYSMKKFKAIHLSYLSHVLNFSIAYIFNIIFCNEYFGTYQQ